MNGLTFSGGYSPGHGRFTMSAIERFAGFDQPGLRVAASDFRLSIPKHRNEMIFMDAPYLKASTNLYGVKGHLHRTFKHQSLAALLHHRDRWILTYDDSPEVRSLYAGYRMAPRQWSAGMNKEKTFGHLIILSHDIVIPPRSSSVGMGSMNGEGIPGVDEPLEALSAHIRPERCGLCLAISASAWTQGIRDDVRD